MKKLLPLVLVLILLAACSGNKAQADAASVQAVGERNVRESLTTAPQVVIDGPAIDKQLRQNEADMKMLIRENKELANTLEELSEAVVESDRAIVNMIRNLEGRVDTIIIHGDGGDSSTVIQGGGAGLTAAQLREFEDLKAQVAALRRELTDAKSGLGASQASAGLAGASSAEANEYEIARSEYDKRNFNTAITKLEAFKTKYPSSKLYSNAIYWQAESYYAQGKVAQALKEFQSVVKSYPQDVKAADSQLKIGMCQLHLGNKQAAREELNKMKTTYPGYYRMDLVNRYLDEAK